MWWLQLVFGVATDGSIQMHHNIGVNHCTVSLAAFSVADMGKTAEFNSNGLKLDGVILKGAEA